MALGGLAGINCHCQWGLTGILLGLVVMLFAGVFAAVPAFFDFLDYPWYIALCWFWFLLGAAMFVFGGIYDCCCIPKEAKAREIQAVEENGDGPISAPTPYIMIN
mmetsp:Transcript_62066/g.116059  ORF Transcript_62066/g.116059 Transcript_62066/m.116059 type:complete len:105 (+) Transcript_62066:81-395(+)